jgi:multiple sugar transport system permease protein
MILTLKAKRRIGQITFHTFIQIMLILVGLLYIFPLFWMFATALKSPSDFLNSGLLPKVANWGNFLTAIQAIPFFRYTGNTVFVDLVATIGTVLSSTIVAYSFARLRWPGRNILFIILLGTLMLPSQVLQVQNFILFNKLGWVNTYLHLTVPFFFNAGAFNIFLLRQFFRGVPMELTEAARIDGCSEFTICYKIIMPLCKPIIAAIAVFAFMNSWNDFFNPLIYLNDPDKFTLALGLRAFQQQHGTQWNYMMAVSLLSMIPTLVLFFSFQKYFVEGITMGGVKE